MSEKEYNLETNRDNIFKKEAFDLTKKHLSSNDESETLRKKVKELNEEYTKLMEQYEILKRNNNPVEAEKILKEADKVFEELDEADPLLPRKIPNTMEETAEINRAEEIKKLNRDQIIKPN